MAEIILNTAPRVNPTIMKGNVISQNIGSMNISASANGQHMTNSIHHNKTAIMNLMGIGVCLQKSKRQTKVANWPGACLKGIAVHTGRQTRTVLCALMNNSLE